MKKEYIGIDVFRLIAAFLVVAIHTSPLASYSETGNFILTRIIARSAVPFYFMTSGFFLLSGHAWRDGRLRAFVKKTVCIYGAAIVLYLPVNIYNGYFGMDTLLPNMIKDIVFDGTLYHLWYLPASVIGAVIAWYLVRERNYQRALAAAFVLYLIGLFGDSYYGISAEIPFLRGFYELIFQVSDYTRNGIFFAPLFFILGGIAADKPAAICRKMTFWGDVCGFLISSALLFGEGMALHYYKVQRHDSMYLFLAPCMYFGFHVILYFDERSVKKEEAKGKEVKRKRRNGICAKDLRTVSLIIYVIHPMIIIIVRMAAKLLALQNLIVKNNFIHYIVVNAVSVLSSVVFTWIWKKCRTQRGSHGRNSARTAERSRKKSEAGGMEKSGEGNAEKTSAQATERVYIELNLDNLAHNIETLQKAMPPTCELMAVVKAEAYGHGMYEAAVYMDRIGVRAFAAATVEEGIALRKYGITGEILILGYTAPARAKELHKYDLMQTLLDYDYALRLNRQGFQVKTHIKVDTGMHRLGFRHEDTEKIARVFSMKYMKVCGIYTHLCAADSRAEEDVCYTRGQIEKFYTLIGCLADKGISIPKIHIQSSYGLMNYPKLQCDYVRAGIALYGSLTSPDDKTELELDLRPALSLRARVILLRRIAKGESVGYGRAFAAERDSVIAILAVGYADGFPRSLSCGKGYVLLHGCRAPIAGRICMDQLAVDVTDIPGVKAGSIATLIGKDGEEEITAAMTAKRGESIANELLSRMGRRVKVVS